MNIVLRSARALSLTTLLLCNQLVVPSLVLAEDATPSASIAPSPTLTPTPSPTPTPTPVPTSSTTTGNASAVGSSSTTANTSSTTVNGNVSASGCSVSGSTGCPVDASNTASVSGSTTAAGSSGNNSTTNGTGNGVISTGTASGSAVVFNALNTTVVTASVSGQTASDSAQPTASSSGTPTGGSVTLANSANLSTTTNAVGVSGQNSASGNGNNGGIKTGDSTAAVSVANLLNTNVIGSNMRFLVININADQQGNINLLQFWKDIEAAAQGKSSATDTGTLAVSLSNTATSSAVLEATAVSGENTANGNGGDGVILSGNSFASAAFVNLINTNLIGSQFLFTIINIFRPLTGDIVIPNAARFLEASSTVGGTSAQESHTIINNDAVLGVSTASASADSGTNQQLRNGGAEIIQSGAAYAHATTTSLLNSTLVGADWFRILLNNFGSWNGGISGWNTPDGFTSVTPYASTTLTLPGEATPSGGLELPSSGSLSVSNTADSRYDVRALARSGGNSTNDNGGNTTIGTGVSVALANVFQMVNTTVIGSRFFFPMINIFNSWNGNLAVAYPSLHVGLTGSAASVNPGAEVQYTVSFVNSGYEDGRNVHVRVELPRDIMYQGNSLGVLPQVSGNTFIFPVGLVKSGVSGSFTISVQVNPQLSAFNTNTSSLLSKVTHIIIPEAYAAGNEREFVVIASIVTSDVAQDTTHNTASITTTVVIPPSPQIPAQNSPPTGAPALTATSTNNVGKYVYQKDTVTFSVTVKNTGTATTQDAHSVQVIQGTNGRPVARIILSLGTIPAGATKKVTYGLKVPASIASGLYTSNISAVGVSEVNGSSVASNTSVTTFLVRAFASSLAPPVFAAEAPVKGKTGEVLGTQTSAVQPCVQKKDLKPYALVALLTILFGIELLRRRHIEDTLRRKLRDQRQKKK